jgi:hypothetical protein
MAHTNISRPAGTVADLADAVTALRAELVRAMEAGKGEAVQFEVGTVTMEFAVEATADAEAKGGVRFWVVELGASGSVRRSATHTVTLEMKPRTKGGGNLSISDRDS